MWECGSWHDSILIGDKVYYLQDLPGKLQLDKDSAIQLHRCAQVNMNLYLLVYQSEPATETYCFFNPDFNVISEEKRAVPGSD